MSTSSKSKSSSHASYAYLFKNGYGMFVKTFQFPPTKGTENESIELLDPPLNPVHGTFWIQSTSNQTSIQSVRTKKTRQYLDKECASVEDLLQANIGERVQLLITNSVARSKEWISGRIKSVKREQDRSSDDEDEDVTGTSTKNILSDDNSNPNRPSIQPNDLLLFETTDNGLLALSLKDIHSIQGATLKTVYQRRTYKNCLSIEYRNQSGSDQIGLMKYLTFGITWAPSYTLVLLSSPDSSKRRLRLTSKAVILNDIENLTVDKLYCIVGFPNISKMANVIDPMLSGKTVKEFLDHLRRSESGAAPSYGRYHAQSMMSNVVMQQQLLQPISFDDNDPTDTVQDTQIDDLHLYEFEKISLQKKERLMLPIFDIETTYKDVYHCKINGSQYGHYYAKHDEQKQYEEVWHSVEFENVSNFVWTTAPIVITKGEQEQQFIGQDTLTYTLKGSTTLVNLTKALDIRIQLDEKVTGTNPTPFSFQYHNYQSDEIEGRLRVMNFKSEEVVVVINLSLTGKMNKYSLEPKRDFVKASESTVNQEHEIRWEITVKPKQTLEIKYIRLYNKRV